MTRPVGPLDDHAELQALADALLELAVALMERQGLTPQELTEQLLDAVVDRRA